MPNESILQPVAKTFLVVDLVDAARKGRIRIPEFQRPLRWQWEDVRRLFDSIVKGYPIGSLLLWVRPAPAADVHLGGLHFSARAFDDGLWVVDGQQRLTSLANALSEEGARDERFALAYDLDQRTFLHMRDDVGHLIPLPVLFDLQKLIRWFTKDHPETSERLDEASLVTRVIREYQVPAYLVSQEDESVLRDIFDRMNNFGKRLSRAEVFAALHPGRDSELERSSRSEQIAVVINAERGFGLIDDDTVLRSVLARRGGNVTRDIRVEFSESTQGARDFGHETPEVAYREGETALSRAVTFLQETAGVPHLALLPYRYLLVVLTRFFAHFPEPRPRTLILLRRWFWRAAMVGPGAFKASWTNAMRTLATRIVANDENGSVQRLLADPIDAALHPPSLIGFRTTAATSRIILSGLWALEPRSLASGRPYTRSDLAEAIQIEGSIATVAQRILRRAVEDPNASAANRILVLEPELSGTAADLLVNPPLERQVAASQFLSSHALTDAMVGALAEDRTSDFLESRQQLLGAGVRTFLERMTETAMEDTPPLDSLIQDEWDEGVRDDGLA